MKSKKIKNKGILLVLVLVLLGLIVLYNWLIPVIITFLILKAINKIKLKPINKGKINDKKSILN